MSNANCLSSEVKPSEDTVVTPDNKEEPTKPTEEVKPETTKPTEKPTAKPTETVNPETVQSEIDATRRAEAMFADHLHTDGPERWTFSEVPALL